MVTATFYFRCFKIFCNVSRIWNQRTRIGENESMCTFIAFFSYYSFKTFVWSYEQKRTGIGTQQRRQKKVSGSISELISTLCRFIQILRVRERVRMRNLSGDSRLCWRPSLFSSSYKCTENVLNFHQRLLTFIWMQCLDFTAGNWEAPDSLLLDSLAFSSIFIYLLRPESFLRTENLFKSA